MDLVRSNGQFIKGNAAVMNGTAAKEGPRSARSARSNLESLLRDLHAHDKDVQVVAADILARRAEKEPEIRTRLLEIMDGPLARARWGAAYALGRLTDEPGLECLQPAITALGTADGDVRWAAAELLLRLGRSYPTQVRQALLDAMAGSDANRCKMALYCLRDLGLGDPDVIAAAEAATSNPDPNVRLAALAFVRRLVPEAETTIALMLERDCDAGVRRAAASALGSIGGPGTRARMALQGCASSADRILSAIAQRALRNLERADNHNGK